MGLEAYQSDIRPDEAIRSREQMRSEITRMSERRRLAALGVLECRVDDFGESGGERGGEEDHLKTEPKQVNSSPQM